MPSVEWNEFAGLVSEYIGVGLEEVTPETNIYNELGIDSLGIVSLGMKLQYNYKVTVPLSEVSGITTLGGMLEVLNRHITAK